MSLPERDRFTLLVETHGPALVGYARRRTRTPEDAADIVADTLLVAWRRLGDVPGEPDTRPWLFGVARRTLANHRRGDDRRERLAGRLAAHLATVPAVEPDDRGADRATIRRALERLGADDRELLTLTAWEGLTPTELAVSLGIPAATVRTRLHRARRRLERELDGERNVDDGHVDLAGRPLGATREHER